VRSHVEIVGLQRHSAGHPCKKITFICEPKPTAGIDEAPVKNSSISQGLIVKLPEKNSNGNIIWHNSI